MGLFLGAVAVVAALLAEPLQDAFLANPVFNGMILTVLVIGIIVNLRQVIQLGPDANWIRAWRASRATPAVPRGGVIGSLTRLLSDRKDKQLQLSAMSMTTLLDGIRSRLDESRDLSRYIIGLLIFLGLLGTFWGLLDTLRAIGNVIGELRIAGAEATAIFDELRSGLAAPLDGMGTAFSSSLFGLAGALVLGFVDLQTTYAQNRFYNDLEEWLSGLTQYSSGGIGAGEGEPTVPAYIQALLEQTADSLDKLQRALTRSEEERRAADVGLITLTEQMSSLVEQHRGEQRMALNITKGQMELQPVLKRLAESLDERRQVEEELRAALYGLDQHLGKLLTRMEQERDSVAEAMRSEIRLLTRTVARAIGAEPPEAR
ncbi:MAG: MotA/TolQ/ExbB proton channel family protein [Ectothiorhodospiraceae bacterium]|nr:MotA/TolQ/ExbB proton channel family protein [Ectothiorhodospiraceae bacterium]